MPKSIGIKIMQRTTIRINAAPPQQRPMIKPFELPGLPAGTTPLELLFDAVGTTGFGSETGGTTGAAAGVSAALSAAFLDSSITTPLKQY
jgi:hypothetical protein